MHSCASRKSVTPAPPLQLLALSLWPPLPLSATKVLKTSPAAKIVAVANAVGAIVALDHLETTMARALWWEPMPN
jgi:hypothetical protein